MRIRKIIELEQNNPNDPMIQKLKRYLSSWKNTIPPYPFMTSRDHKFTAESKCRNLIQTTDKLLNSPGFELLCIIPVIILLGVFRKKK